MSPQKTRKCIDYLNQADYVMTRKVTQLKSIIWIRILKKDSYPNSKQRIDAVRGMEFYSVDFPLTTTYNIRMTDVFELSKKKKGVIKT
jgi:hypothetical protein